MTISNPYGPPKQTLFIIDISSFIFRAYYGIRALNNSHGEPTNAVLGVANMLVKLVDQAEPQNMAVAFDSKGPSFRHEMYDEYKANRNAPPDDLIPQFDRINQLIESLEIPAYRQDGIEADDLIATLTQKWLAESPKNHVTIVSGDKDLMQLVNGRVVVWDTMKEKIYRHEDVVEKFGVEPEQIRDYLAMVGDSSDNIPGVPSIGPKGAAQLLSDFNDLKGVLKAARAGEIKGKKGEVLQSHQDQALLSQKLVTLKENVKIPFKSQDVSYRFAPTPASFDLLKELEFGRIADRWRKRLGTGAQATANANGTSNGPSEAGQTFAVTEESQFLELVESIKTASQVTMHWIMRAGDQAAGQDDGICGLALVLDSAPDQYYVVLDQDLKKPGKTDGLPLEWSLKKLRVLFENASQERVCFYSKNLATRLRHFNIKTLGLLHDCGVLGFVVDPSGKHTLEFLAEKHLEKSLPGPEAWIGKGKSIISWSEVDPARAAEYWGERVRAVHDLWNEFSGRINKKGRQSLKKIYEDIDQPLIAVLSRMEDNGVCLDKKYLTILSKQYEKEISALQKKIEAYSEEPINLNSPKQLAQLLFEELGLPTQTKKKTGYSTDAKVLEKLSSLHEVPQLLIEYRELSKLKGTYIDPLPEMTNPRTGKIHAQFHQTVAATGRLSSSDPNLQNIPIRTERGQLIRKAFIPSKGNILLSADYSQVELRILAHMSQDPELVKSFKTGEDVHRRTASEIYEVEVDQVDSHQRGVAKAINFGLMYGKTPFGLAEELKISRNEAKEMIDRYFTRYHAVKKFLDGLITSAQKNGHVETLFGRVRPLPEINSKNHAIRANAERMAMNSPIQGTAADLIKMAMVKLVRRLQAEQMKSELIIQVHDELVMDCLKDEVEAVSAILKEVMENVVEFSVPLTVNVATGKNWMDCK